MKKKLKIIFFITLLSIIVMLIGSNIYLYNKRAVNDTVISFGILEENKIKYFKDVEKRDEIDEIQRILINSDTMNNKELVNETAKTYIQFKSAKEIGTIYLQLEVWNDNEKIIWKERDSNTYKVTNETDGRKLRNYIDKFTQ